MKDRVPLYPGRVKLVPVSGQSNVYDLERADAPTEAGTPINKATLLKDATASALGLSAATATPDDGFQVVADLRRDKGLAKNLSGDLGRVATSKKRIYGIDIGAVNLYANGNAETSQYFLFGSGTRGLYIVDKKTFVIRILADVPCACLSVIPSGQGAWALMGYNLTYVTLSSGATRKYTISSTVGSVDRIIAYDSSMVVLGAATKLYPVKNGAVGTPVTGSLYSSAIIGSKLYYVYQSGGIFLARAALSSSNNTITVEQTTEISARGSSGIRISALFTNSDAFVLVDSESGNSSGYTTCLQMFRYPLSSFSAYTWYAYKNFDGTTRATVFYDTNYFYAFVAGITSIYKYSKSTGALAATISATTPGGGIGYVRECNPPGKVVPDNCHEIRSLYGTKGVIINKYDSLLYDTAAWNYGGPTSTESDYTSMNPSLCTSEGHIILDGKHAYYLSHLDMGEVVGFLKGGA